MIQNGERIEPGNTKGPGRKHSAKPFPAIKPWAINPGRPYFCEEVTKPQANKAATTTINVTQLPNDGLAGTALLKLTMFESPSVWDGKIPRKTLKTFIKERKTTNPI